MNGYFRLVSMEQGYGLEFIPPCDKGENIRIAEVVDYLEKNNLIYDLSVLKEKIESEMQYPGTIKITVVRETRAQEEAK